MPTLDHRRRGSSQPFLLTALEALDRRLWLPAIECVLVAAFVLVIALDGHRVKTSRLAKETAPTKVVATQMPATAGAEAPAQTPSDNPIATEMQPRPRDMGSPAPAGSFPSIIPPSLQQEYPRETTAAGAAVLPDAAGSNPATDRPQPDQPPPAQTPAPAQAPLPAQAGAESSATTESPSRAREVAMAAPPSIIPPALQYQYPRETAATGPATTSDAASEPASGATPSDKSPPAQPAAESTPAPTAPASSGQAAFEAALMGRPRRKAPDAPAETPPGNASPRADATASATPNAPPPTATAPSGQAAFEAALMGRPRAKAPEATPETPPGNASPRADATASATPNAPPPTAPTSSGQAAFEAALMGRPRARAPEAAPQTPPTDASPRADVAAAAASKASPPTAPASSGQAAFEAALMGRPRRKAPDAASETPATDASPRADVAAAVTSKASPPTAATSSGQAAFEAALMGRPRRKAPDAPAETPPSNAGPSADVTASATPTAPPPTAAASSGQAAFEAALLGRSRPRAASEIDALSKTPPSPPEDGVTIDPAPDPASPAKAADAERSASVSSPGTPNTKASSGQVAFEAALTGRRGPKAAPVADALPEPPPRDASPPTDATASATSTPQPSAASPAGQAALEAALTGRSRPKTFGIDASPAAPSLPSDGVSIDPAPVDVQQDKPIETSGTPSPIASNQAGLSGQSAFEAALAGRTRPRALPVERSPETPSKPPTKVAALDPAPPTVPKADLAGHTPPPAAPSKSGAVSEVPSADSHDSWDQARAKAGLLAQPGSEKPAAKPTPPTSTPPLRDIAVPPGTIPKPGEAANAPVKAAADRADAKTASKSATPSERPVVPSQTKVARLEPEEVNKGQARKLREQQDFADAFQSASRMLERRLTPDERAAPMAPDYVDAIQRMEGIYDPTKVGPFGSGLRMAIRPGTMSMTDVFGERWTRADPDPNVHYRVGFHAETWLRPRSRKCEEFWRFRTDDSPVALDKLAPTDCARVRSKPESDTKLMADSTIVAAPISVPTFAAPYPGGRMSHDELMAALKARADAAREKLWYGRSHGLVEQKPRPAPALAPSN